MPPQSSAKFVSYDLRPAKQCERRLMLESFYTAMEAGLGVTNYRYVGMGGNRFYDFVLMHKYLGIDEMVSVEHDRGMFARAKFNKPYQFIQVVCKSAGEFISADRYAGNTIYWLDYDGRLRQEIVQDIASLVPTLTVGDFVFVTVCAEVPPYVESSGASERLVELRDRFGDLAYSLKLGDMEKAEFNEAVHKILRAAFQNAFVYRREGLFRPFFQVEYADGVDMMTYGGIFATKGDGKAFVDLLKDKVPFLQGPPKARYRIKKIDLTEKERSLFDLAVTANQPDTTERLQLKSLGFRAAEFRRYGELLRYHPRYVETLV